MATKSPTISVRSREIIGVDQFSQRREVFDKHDTVFLPLASPTNMAQAPATEGIITTNHDNTNSNFKRNAPGYSSMRETKTDENYFAFRPRKYSDNFTSELNQSDDVDYRFSMTERTRRLSKLRRDFLTSNLHEPTNDSPFSTRTGVRASMPTQRSASVLNHKIESPVIYKFAFTEPYTTPTPVRKIFVNLGPSGIEKDKTDKENEDPEVRNKHQSLPNNSETTKIDHQKLFEELVKRYSPQRKPIDWTLPPTKPRVVASLPKPSSSTTDSIKNANSQEELSKSEDDDVFNKEDTLDAAQKKHSEIKSEPIAKDEIIQNGIDTASETNNKENITKNQDSKVSLREEAEKNDMVPELSAIQRQISRESAKKPQHKEVDLTIPALIEKITAEGEGLENQKKDKKVKRKRSFLDKLLGRKKDKV